MKWLLILSLLISVRGYSQNDSTVLLTKKGALFYYEQYKRAQYLEKKLGRYKIQLDSTISIVKEKNIQLDTYKVELDASKLMTTASNSRLAVARTDYEHLETRFKRVRKERNLVIGGVIAYVGTRVAIFFLSR